MQKETLEGWPLNIGIIHGNICIFVAICLKALTEQHEMNQKKSQTYWIAVSEGRDLGWQSDLKIKKGRNTRDEEAAEGSGSKILNVTLQAIE